tara:strand:- start:11976 stop:12221 length:246 start_codon:yes stop_codon:yes gene_type:complete
MKTDKEHGLIFHNKLKGKTISSVRYMTDVEIEAWGWYKKAVVISFTDGSWIVPQMDDEGNDGGALFLMDKNKEENIIYNIQ